MVLHSFEEAAQDVLDQLAQVDFGSFSCFCNVSIFEKTFEELEYGWLSSAT